MTLTFFTVYSILDRTRSHVVHNYNTVSYSTYMTNSYSRYQEHNYAPTDMYLQCVLGSCETHCNLMIIIVNIVMWI